MEQRRRGSPVQTRLQGPPKSLRGLPLAVWTGLQPDPLSMPHRVLCAR
jgi:hypothetical protein